MSEFWINLFHNEKKEGNRPHFKALFKIEGVDYECSFWPAKEGKKGYSGKAKPKEAYVTPETIAPETKQAVAAILDDEIPF